MLPTHNDAGIDQSLVVKRGPSPSSRVVLVSVLWSVARRVQLLVLEARAFTRSTDAQLDVTLKVEQELSEQSPVAPQLVPELAAQLVVNELPQLELPQVRVVATYIHDTGEDIAVTK